MGSGGVQIREVPLYTCTIVTMYHTVSGQLDIKNDDFTFAVGNFWWSDVYVF